MCLLHKTYSHKLCCSFDLGWDAPNYLATCLFFHVTTRCHMTKENKIIFISTKTMNIKLAQWWLRLKAANYQSTYPFHHEVMECCMTKKHYISTSTRPISIRLGTVVNSDKDLDIYFIRLQNHQRWLGEHILRNLTWQN